MKKSDVDAIRARTSAATPGPWGSHSYGTSGVEEPAVMVVHTGEQFDWGAVNDGDYVAKTPEWTYQDNADTDFIAHARQDVPALLAEVENLRAEMDAAHRHLVMMAAETGWATDGVLWTGVRHVEEVLRRRTAERDEAVSPESVEATAEILRLVVEAGGAVPAIFPGEDGVVQMVWSSSGKRATIEVLGADSISGRIFNRTERSREVFEWSSIKEFGELLPKFLGEVLHGRTTELGDGSTTAAPASDRDGRAGVIEAAARTVAESMPGWNNDGYRSNEREKVNESALDAGRGYAEALETAGMLARRLPSRDQLLALIPSPVVSEQVSEWPADERELHRREGWRSFDERGAAVDLLRRQKVVEAILALLTGDDQ